MYLEDSFFTLSVGGRLGLALLSLMLAALTFIAAALAFRRLTSAAMPLRLLARIALALLLLYLFDWLSPQVYYLYYQALFEGLPWQIVVKPPPRLSSLAELLSFTAGASLSHHSRGLLGWALILYALAPLLRTALPRS